MFDTVAYACELQLNAEHVARGVSHIPYGFVQGDTVGGTGMGTLCSSSFKNQTLGVRLLGSRSRDVINISKVEAELPTVLFGHNGRVLQDQAEVDSALHRVGLLVGELCEPGGDCIPNDANPKTRFTRVDVGWNLAIPTAEVIHAMEHAKHPAIHRPTVRHAGTCLTFDGTKQRIVIYDKARKSRVKLDHPVTRFEVQLREDKIASVFHTERLTALSFRTAYEVFRERLLAFRFTEVVPASRGRLIDFLAYEQAIHPDEDVVADYVKIRGNNERFHRDLRKQVARIIPAFRTFSLASLFPEDLPPLLEVLNSKKEAEFQDYLRTMGFDRLFPPPPPRVPRYG